MKRRRFLISSMLAPVALTAAGNSDKGSAAGGTSNVDSSASKSGGSSSSSSVDAAQAAAIDAMKRAVNYMDQTVSYRGGYVWAYLPDLTTTWGEMEAKRTMCWIQPPGTPTAGHAILDAYHATGDELFYNAALRTGLALIEAQHPAGGWNYIHDFAGEDSLKHWYETVGANGWRLEEFQHYYGNATFDDAGTAVASQFMLRMYLEKKDARFLAPLNRAIDFVVKSQFAGGVADGGWPQRWPPYDGAVLTMNPPNPSQLPVGAFSGMEDGDYTRFVTFNDDVAGENIKFLLLCVIGLGRTDLIAPVGRAMECMRRMQQPAPQAGWGLQHLSVDTNGRPAGAPAAARSYEPRGLATHTTQTNVRQLFNYFLITGDRKYLARVPEAIAWLETCRLPADAAAINPLLAKRSHPTFVELGTNEARYVHRYGSNIHNGAYYVDKDLRNTPSHYSAGRNIDVAALQKTYDRYSAMTDAQIAEMVKGSPLKATAARALPKYFSIREVDFPDLFEGAVMATPTVTADAASTLVTSLGDKNYWLTAIPAVTNPYRGNGPTTAYKGAEYMSKHVGDIYDTSPYDPQDPPLVSPYVKKDRPLGISTSHFVSNLGKLIAFVAPVKKG
ncbi:MAG: pectate lyase [Rhodocyclaceae bacterium]